MTIWVGTDWHLIEYNAMVKGEMRNPRALSTLSKYKDCVANSDIFIYLGDICYKDFTDQKKLTDMISDLPGYKVFIRGNHDRQDAEFYYKAGFDIVCDAATLDNLLFTHKPVDLSGADGDIVNVHGHMHNQTFRTFDGKHVNPYGYCHGTFVELRKVLAAAKTKLIDPKEFTPMYKSDEMVTISEVMDGFIFDLTEIVLNGPDGHPIDEDVSSRILNREADILNDIIFDFDDVKLAARLGRPDDGDEEDFR